MGSSPTRGSSFFLGKVTALGVLCCFALFVCLTLLASFFLPSHLSFKNMYMYPGAKDRVITREARYNTITRAFASFYAIISRAHVARAVTRQCVKIISARQFKGAHKRCVKVALEDPAHSREFVRIHARSVCIDG